MDIRPVGSVLYLYKYFAYFGGSVDSFGTPISSSRFLFPA